MKKRLLDWLVNLLVVGGMAAICGGLALIYVPLGVIALGVCSILMAWLLRG